jgi:hypothetical protein
VGSGQPTQLESEDRMGEQDLRIDPETGFPFSDRRSQDSKQNKNYVRHSDPAETARDYSRPHTIPKEEFEHATGRNHEQAIEQYHHDQELNRQEADKVQRAAQA